MENQKSEEEFTRLVPQSQGIIYKVSKMYCENEEHRKDLLQEILIQLWIAYPSFKGASNFSTWMYREAFNVAIQDLRKTKKSSSFFFKPIDLKKRLFLNMII